MIEELSTLCWSKSQDKTFISQCNSQFKFLICYIEWLLRAFEFPTLQWLSIKYFWSQVVT